MYTFRYFGQIYYIKKNDTIMQGKGKMDYLLRWDLV